ncbi:MAG: Fic family protein [Candidatus Nomurabacteria bacterium]|nr:Fic family protein [Candidatus Nomurabacteria bacterium]
METPIFTVTPKSLDLVAKIAEMVGELQGSGEYARNLHLRKVNRIRSIHSSLAIEANTLSIEQVTDIINGKRILGKPSEIQEVKNAYEAYEHLLEYSPYSVDDLLRAHKYMTDRLIDSAGHYRNKGVGVWNGDNLIHAGAHQDFVPKLITDLLNWAKDTDIHPLIKSAIVHFEIEFIHPFADGNGRTGRLWQTLILSEWNEIFAWIPIETVVYENQGGYYEALGTSERSTDSGAFIEFMLDAIYQALSELPVHKITDIFTDIDTDKLSRAELEFLEQIAGFIDKNGEITNYRARLLTNKSDVSVKQYLAKFVELGLLDAIGENKGRKYVVKKGGE